MRMWNELTPEEGDWLEAHRHLFGLPEDRLRHALAWAVHLLWPHGERLDVAEIERLMNPFNIIKGEGGEAGVQEVSPDQAAAMAGMFFSQHGR